MAKNVVRLSVLGGLLVVGAMTAVADAQSAVATSTPRMLVIYREEVRPGRGAAHAANESAWAAAFAKGGAPERWLGMTTVIGPSEAWFLSGYASYADYQQAQDAIQSHATLSAESDKFSAQEVDLLSRVSTIVVGYRPALSYRADVKLPEMRYMQVDVVRVKQGFDRDFRMAWRQVVEAHTKAQMEEHWAVYEVEAGTQDLTFFFFYPRKTLAEIDQAGPMHTSDAYRDAVGENGRLEQREMSQRAIESSQTYVFQLRPSMSVLTQEWIDGDPAFWAPKPAPPARK